MERDRGTGGRRILVIANETCRGQALLDEIRRRVGDDGEVMVVAPALTRRLQYWVSDVDAGIHEAEERVRESVEELRRQAIRAHGEVGDCDPLMAIEDALATFHADEVIISTHPPGRSNWLEKKVPGRAEQRFDVPITHVVVDLEHEREAALATSRATSR